MRTRRAYTYTRHIHRVNSYTKILHFNYGSFRHCQRTTSEAHVDIKRGNGSPDFAAAAPGLVIGRGQSGELSQHCRDCDRVYLRHTCRPGGRAAHLVPGEAPQE